MNAKLPPQGKAPRGAAAVPVLAGRYALERELAVRPLVTAYRAIDLAAHRTVIVELLDDALVQDPQLRERLEAEAQRAATLRHDNLVAFYDLCLDHSPGYSVREHVDGATLNEILLCAGRPLPLFEVLQVAEQVAGALGAAHRAGMLHKAVNPQNILMRRDGRVLLSGLGLPSLIGISTESELDPSYFAPEQYAAAATLDPRTDSYGLAAIAFLLCAGQPPFTGVSDDEPAGQGATGWERVQWLTVNAPPPFASKVNRDLPRGLAWVLQKGLAKKPAERFHSPADFCGALERAMSEAGLDPKAMRAEPPGWRRDAEPVPRGTVPFLKQAILDLSLAHRQAAGDAPPSQKEKAGSASREKGSVSFPSLPRGGGQVESSFTRPAATAAATQALPTQDLQPSIRHEDRLTQAVPTVSASAVGDGGTGKQPAAKPAPKPDPRSGPLMWLGGLLLVAVVVWAALLVLLLTGEEQGPSAALAGRLPDFVSEDGEMVQGYDLGALPTWTPPVIARPTDTRVSVAAWQPPPPQATASTPGGLLYNAMRPPTTEFDWPGYVRDMQWRSYTDPRFGFAMVYPNSWAMDHADNVLRLYMPDRDAGVIVCSCGTRVADANQWASRFLDLLRRDHPDLKEVDRRPLNARWLSTLAQVPGEGDDVQVVVLTSGAGQRGYAVAFVSWASDWQGVKPLFDRMARDMRFP